MARNGRCELCQKNPSSEVYMRVDLCSNCYKIASTAWTGDLDSIDLVLSSGRFPNPTDTARDLLIEGIRIRSKRFEAQRAEHERKKAEEAAREAERLRLEAERRRAREAEEARQFAAVKDVNDLFEYHVEIIENHADGRVNELKIRAAILEYASKGWRLHTAYSSEIGKTSNSYAGYGTNATICQDVLIFERRIKKQ